MITVLTPTFNREKELQVLYESLVRQTSKDFEWLIVDDGSFDGTPSLVNGFIDQGLIVIRYLAKENSGKHGALNVGFSDARAREWIFVVDSDDSLADDCLEVIEREVKKLSTDYIAIRMLQSDKKGKELGSYFPATFKTYFDLINSKQINDNADVFRKSSLVDFRFPLFEGENFMAESPLYLKLGRVGLVRFINYKGYVAEYLPGGLTDRSVSNRHRCFNSSLYVYECQFKEKNLKFIKRVKAGVNWWRFRLNKPRVVRSFRGPSYLIPFGLVLYLNDRFVRKVY